MQSKILICMNINDFAQHPFLAGILSVTRLDGSLSVVIDTKPGELTVARFRRHLDSGIAAAIICETGIPDIRAVVNSCRTPIVVFGSPKSRTRRQGLCYVMSDDTGIGIAGARHLFAIGGFRSFAFAATPGEGWSDKEERGFLSFLERKRRPVQVCRDATDAELDAFLVALEKPAAVMAANDLRALDVVNACRRQGIDIPRQLSLIGVNDNEVLCNGVSPSLTSIGVDHEHEGRLAIECLLNMLRSPQKPHPALIRPKGHQVVERESTAIRTSSAHIIEKALAYIDRHINRPIRVGELVAHLHVSRRLLEIRFREILQSSVNATIVNRRLDHYRSQLLVSKLPARAVANACGFSDMSYLTRTFKARFSVTPGAFREQHSPQTQDSAVPFYS